MQIAGNSADYDPFVVLEDNADQTPRVGLFKYRSGLNSGKIAFQVYNGSGSSEPLGSVAGSSLPTNTWIHVVGVVDYPANKAYLYYNGQQDASATLVTFDLSTAASLRLHTGLFAGNEYLNGKVDETRIYNRALSPAEVAQLYNFAPGPKAHLKMDEGSGISAADSSGNSNTGTLNDGPTWSTGKFGKGVTLDGTNDDVSVPDIGY